MSVLIQNLMYTFKSVSHCSRWRWRSAWTVIENYGKLRAEWTKSWQLGRSQWRLGYFLFTVWNQCRFSSYNESPTSQRFSIYQTCVFIFFRLRNRRRRSCSSNARVYWRFPRRHGLRAWCHFRAAADELWRRVATIITYKWLVNIILTLSLICGRRWMLSAYSRWITSSSK